MKCEAQPAEACCVCRGPVYSTCLDDHICPDHPNDCELSNGDWVCSVRCWYTFERWQAASIQRALVLRSFTPEAAECPVCAETCLPEEILERDGKRLCVYCQEHFDNEDAMEQSLGDALWDDGGE